MCPSLLSFNGCLKSFFKFVAFVDLLGLSQILELSCSVIFFTRLLLVTRIFRFVCFHHVNVLSVKSSPWQS